MTTLVFAYIAYADAKKKRAFVMSGRNSVLVAIKLRPICNQPSNWRVVDNSIQLVDSQAEPYYFDHIFDQDATNQIIFDKMAKPIVHSAIEGFNGTIFAYGQTSSGKTYTMMGDEENPGVMVLAAKEIFKEIQQHSDRQFLLRVGYIEIYNERIYDLLNKKNQDLKIHESNGIINVNCEEIIIMCENDLLHYLKQGSKERTVGETNMNERSSRSHAIFRIIIESRKIDRTEEDTVTQSIINLVDLAGSERADQTGARGARLKEGGHINKSLLFLGTVIKRLSENEDKKYICYRESKLTRILQDSLGGNTLTAIICTIKPNTIEETQSTLSFALRAKVIKNKPAVNEIVSDATAMKRLEKEITVLKSRLAEERRKNESQIKVGELETRIKNEVLKIITSHTLHVNHDQHDKRRRTWCPMSTKTNNLPSALPIPINQRTAMSGVQSSKISSYHTPLITLRASSPVGNTLEEATALQTDMCNISEEFIPGELVDFDKLALTKTPRQGSGSKEHSLTPKLFSNPKLTCEDLQKQVDQLIAADQIARATIDRYENDLSALKSKLAQLEMENRNAVNLDFELQRLKNKSKLRETELLEFITEKDNAILKLEKSLKSLSAEKFQNTKESMQISVRENSKTDEKICIKCEDLQEMLAENEKVSHELEKLKLQYEKLELNYTEALQRNERKLNAVDEDQAENKEYLQEDIQTLKEKLQTIQEAYEKLTKETAADEQSLNEKLEYNASAMKMLQDKYQKLENSWQEQQQSLNDIQTQYDTVQSKYLHLQNEYERLEMSSEKYLADRERLQSQNETLQSDINDLKQLLKDAELKLLEKPEIVNDTQKENSELKMQLNELQNQFEDLQKEYDDLSSQLMDNLQENESLKAENTKLIDELKILKDKNSYLSNKELEIVELKAELERLSFLPEKQLMNYPILASNNSSLRSSGVGVEDEECMEKDDTQKLLLKKFTELSTSLGKIELELSGGNVKIFQVLDSDIKSHAYKLCLSDIKNVIEFITDQQNDIATLEGTLNHLNFQIKELKPDDLENTLNNSETSADSLSEYQQKIESLQDQINKEQMANKSLLGNTERTLNEMKEQIIRLNGELLEKSIVVEKCACESYQKKISDLEKDKAEMSMINKELLKHSTFNNTPTAMNMNGLNCEECEDCKIWQTTQREMQEVIKDLTQRYLELQKQLEQQAQEHKDQIINLELNNLQKVELSDEDYHKNLLGRNEYEANVVQQQLEERNRLETEDTEETIPCKTELIKRSPSTENVESLQNTSQGWEILAEKQLQESNEHKIQLLEQEVIDKERQCKEYETEIQELSEKIKNSMDQQQLMEKKLNHYLGKEEELRQENQNLTDEQNKILADCEELRAKFLSLTKETEAIKVSNLKLRDLEINNEQLLLERNQLAFKLQNAEQQVSDFCKEDAVREEIIQDLQNKLNDVQVNFSQSHVPLEALTACKNEKLEAVLELQRIKQENEKIEKRLTETENRESKQQKIFNEKMELIAEENRNTNEKLAQMTLLADQFKQFEVKSLEEKNALENQNKILHEEKLAAEQRFSQIIEEKMQQIKQLQQTCDNLTQEFIHKQEQISALTRAAEELRENENENLKTIKTLDNENKILKAQHLKRDEQLNELSQKSCNLLKEEIDLLKGEKKNLEEKLAQLADIKEQKAALEEQHKQLEAESLKQKDNSEKQVALLQEEKLDVEKRFLQEIKERSVLEIQHQTLKEEHNLLTASCKELKDRENKQQVEIDCLHKQIELFNEEKSNHAENLKQLEDKKAKICALEENLKELEEKKNALEKQVQTLQQEKLLGKTNFEELIEEKENQLKKLQENCDHLNQAYSLQQEKISIVTQELEKFREIELKNLKQENEELLENITALSKTKETLQSQKSDLEKLLNECKASMKEVSIKCDRLRESNEQLHQTNDQLKQALANVPEHFGLEKDFATLQLQYKELQDKMEAATKESDRCSKTLRDEVQHYKQLLENQLESYNNLRHDLSTKELTFKHEKEKLNSEIVTLENEKRKLEVHIKEIMLKNLKEEVGKPSHDSNTSIDFNLSHSPRSSRHSFEGNISPDQNVRQSKLNVSDNVEHKNKIIERKNRRSSVHDERRRQSYWGVMHDKETMTIPADTKCNCEELDEKLRECKRDLYIRQSQVTALNMELKNHPLIAENASLTKRIQEEQEKYRIDMKRYKQKLHEQTTKAEKALNALATSKTELKQLQQLQKNAGANDEEVSAAASTKPAVTPSSEVLNAQVQTDGDLNDMIQSLQGKNNDLKKICRFRYKTIKDLEEKMAQKENTEGNTLSGLEVGQIKSLKNQNESLNKELKIIQQKYENAKIILQSRRDEIRKLQEQLNVKN
uniref:Centromere-associated protein E n=1 Tax=Glossina austeni TaxID=7395 RepID=A0A1A9UXB9_GLOAU